MKHLFLTSSESVVITDVISRLDFDPNGKKLVFIKTASEDEEGDKSWLNEDRVALVEKGFLVTDYSVSGKNRAQLRQDLMEYDILFVSGGNTFYLLQESQQSGFIEVIQNLVLNEGKLYIGSSAGSVIAGPDISPVLNLDDKDKASKLKGFEGFKLVDFVVLPHWGGSDYKKAYLNSRFDHIYGMDNKIIFLTDNQYVEVKDDWYRVIDITKP